jgi:predicted phage terminase large subunit-like protein
VIRGVRRVVVMQRLHENDLTGHLLKKGNWAHLCLPMRRLKVVPAQTPIAFVDPRPSEGDLLWPAGFSAAAVADLALDLGSMGTAGQLQQQPAPAAGAMVKRAWFRFYRELPADLDETVLSLDCAFKDNADNDYVAAGIFARKGSTKYLVHRVKDRLDFPATIALVRTLSAAYPKAYAKLVEDKANGPAVIQSLKNEIAGLIAVNPQGSKVARLAAVSPTIEAGNFYLPDPAIAPWVEDYIHELTTFPNAANDDQVDMTTQVLNRWQSGTTVKIWRAGR